MFCCAPQKFASLSNTLSMDKLNSTVNSYLRSSTSSDDSVRPPDEKKRKESKESSSSDEEALGRMAEGLAEKIDLILTKLSKLDKLDDIELRLKNLAASVSSIEMSMNQLEKEVSVLDSKTKTI